MNALTDFLPWLLLITGMASLAVALFPALVGERADGATTAAAPKPVRGTDEKNTARKLLRATTGRGARVTAGVLLVGVGAALFLNLSWMQWTSSTAAFFIGLFTLLLIMTLWDIARPTEHTSGFLPIAFSRGERLFLSFMIFFGVVGLWIAFLPDVTLWGALATAAVLIAVVAWFG